MVASQLPCFAFFVCLKWPLRSSDFLSRNCLNVGKCFAAGAARLEGEARLRLVWLMSEALPTMLSLEDKDLSASTLLRNLGKKQMTISNLCRNSSKTCSIDQRWLLFEKKEIESAANNATRPHWQCSPRDSPRVIRPFLAHWVPGIILCTGKHICALKNIYVHWKIYLCTETYLCTEKYICALENIFVHWKIYLCTEKHARVLENEIVNWIS